MNSDAIKLYVDEWRRVRNVSQQTIAENLGVHPNTYRRWEKNPESIPVVYAIKICERLDVPFDSVIFLPNKSTKM